MALLPFTIEPVERTGHYKHMAKRDAAVWTRFLERFGRAWEGVAYDVALGGALPAAGVAGDELAEGWQYSTALKVDAILFSRELVLVCEVRPWATVSALGAAVAYALVAEREQLSPLPLAPAIVCEGIQADVEWACGRLNVQVWKV